MFEQAILAEPTGHRKSGAILVSLLAQIAICGVLVIVPLIFSDTLALPTWDYPLPVVAPPRPPEPPVREQQTLQRVRVRNVYRPSVLEAPPRIPPRVTIIEDEPAISIPGALEPTGPSFIGRESGVIGIFETAPPPPIPAPTRAVEVPKPTAVQQGPMHVTSSLQASKLITRVVPSYPAIALQTRVSGVVKLLAIIGKDGRVRELKVIEGHALLRQAAIDAVRQWVYSPTILGGVAMEVEAPVDVNFILGQR